MEAFKAVCLRQFLSSLHQQITFQANKRCYYSERMTKHGSGSKRARERRSIGGGGNTERTAEIGEVMRQRWWDGGVRRVDKACHRLC